MREDEGWREAHSAKRVTTHALHCPEGGVTTSHQTDGVVLPMTDPTGAPVPTDKRLLVFLGGGEEGWDIKRKQTAARQQQGQAGLKAACRPKQLNSAGGGASLGPQTLPRPFWLGASWGTRRGLEQGHKGLGSLQHPHSCPTKVLCCHLVTNRW